MGIFFDTYNSSFYNKHLYAYCQYLKTNSSLSLAARKEFAYPAIYMEIYTTLAPLLLFTGAALQGIFVLRACAPWPVAFPCIVLGAGFVLCSAWMERDLVLLFGQLFVLLILLRRGQKK